MLLSDKRYKTIENVSYKVYNKRKRQLFFKGVKILKDFCYDEWTSRVLEQLQKGAFLTVQADGKMNTMTIGWATLGYLWKLPVMTVYVRRSRYTFDLLKNARDFTVSVPLDGQLKKELGYVGKFSGRDMDKFDQTGLKALPSERVESPAIAGCNIVYECKILARQTLEQKHFNDLSLYEHIYSDHDLHTVFYGEIVHYRKF